MSYTDLELELQKYIYLRIQKENKLVSFFENDVCWFTSKEWTLKDSHGEYFWIGLGGELNSIGKELHDEYLLTREKYTNLNDRAPTLRRNLAFDFLCDM